ncbi:DnaJ protein [Phlyctochytrium arcticum]|nr:DnaJ protein [Phlyctochytrium arcticum]
MSGMTGLTKRPNFRAHRLTFMLPQAQPKRPHSSSQCFYYCEQLWTGYTDKSGRLPAAIRCVLGTEQDYVVQNRCFHATPPASAAKKDAYKVLNIKKAYYKLARDFHPDTSKDPNAKDKFIEIQEAYDILSDDQKRANYDQFGHSAFGGGEGPTGAGGFGDFGGFGGGGNPFGGGFGSTQDIFEHIFSGGMGGMPGMGGRGGGGRGGFDSVGRNIKTAINISFVDAAKGTSRTIRFKSVGKCKPCTGSGLKPGKKANRCTTCGGSGQVAFIRGGFQMATTCPACGGAGSQVPADAKCTSCEGQGRGEEPRTVEVTVPPGVYDGIELRLARQGNAPLEGNGPEGDLFVTLRVAPDPTFHREGADVLVDAEVPLSTAILGGTIRVPTIDGDVELSVPAGTQPNDRKRLRQRGVRKIDRAGDERGDEWVKESKGVQVGRFSVKTHKFLFISIKHAELVV